MHSLNTMRWIPTRVQNFHGSSVASSSKLPGEAAYKINIPAVSLRLAVNDPMLSRGLVAEVCARMGVDEIEWLGVMAGARAGAFCSTGTHAKGEINTSPAVMLIRIFMIDSCIHASSKSSHTWEDLQQPIPTRSCTIRAINVLGGHQALQKMSTQAE